jgi:hypothetical protein
MLACRLWVYVREDGPGIVKYSTETGSVAIWHRVGAAR